MVFVPDALLFSGSDMQAVLRRQIEHMEAEVQQASAEILFANPHSDFVRYLTKKYVLDLPTLQMREARKYSSEGIVPDLWPVEVNARYGGRMVHGTVFNLEIPYRGHKSFFFVQPTRSPNQKPRGYEREGCIIVTIAGGASLTAERVTRWLTEQTRDIGHFLELQRADEVSFTPTFIEAANSAVFRRVAKLKRDIEMTDAIPFPLKERPGAPKTYVVPSVRRKLFPQLRQSSSIEAQPILEEEHYKHILSVIEQMTTVIEHSPSAFANMEEEEIRVHYLVQLNGHYIGNATGETFNLEGKTDISIRDNGVVIFIAELKIWDGPHSLREAIDQLLGYVSWRETKAALVIFNRNKGFSKMIEAAVEEMARHPNFSSGPKKEHLTRYRYVFRNRDDEERLFSLTLLLFDVKGAAKP